LLAGIDLLTGKVYALVLQHIVIQVPNEMNQAFLLGALDSIVRRIEI
jgi:hypothetical protein